MRLENKCIVNAFIFKCIPNAFSGPKSVCVSQVRDCKNKMVHVFDGDREAIFGR